MDVRESTVASSSGAVRSRSLYTMDSISQDTRDKSRRIKSFLLGRVSLDKYLASQFIFLALATGMADAVTYGTYGVFSTKQTGNAIFFALYVLGHPSATSVHGMQRNIGISIGTFILGAVFFGQMGRLVNQRRRIWLLAANLFQTILVFAAAGIRYSQGALDLKPIYVDWRYDTRPQAMGVIALLSFVFGGQISLAVSVRLGEINTALIDVCLILFTMDRRILALKNPDRNRRGAFLVAFVSGGFLGALAIRYGRVFTALMVVGGLKLLVTLSFLFNKGINREHAIEKEEDIEANAQNWRVLLSANCSTARVSNAGFGPVNGVLVGSGSTTPLELVAQTAPCQTTVDAGKRGVLLEVPHASSRQIDSLDLALRRVSNARPPSIVVSEAPGTGNMPHLSSPGTPNITFSDTRGLAMAQIPRSRPPSIISQEAARATNPKFSFHLPTPS